MIVIVLSLMLLSLLTILVLYQRRGARHMRALAMTDELTGAPNRRAVRPIWQRNWSEATRRFARSSSSTSIISRASMICTAIRSAT